MEQLHTRKSLLIAIIVLLFVALVIGIAATVWKSEPSEQVRILKPPATEAQKAQIDASFAQKEIEPVSDAQKAQIVSTETASTQLTDSQKQQIEQNYINSHSEIINK